MRRTQPDDRVENATHPQSALTPVAGCETFVPSRNYATKPLNCVNRTGNSLLAATRGGQEAAYEGLARADAKPGTGEREVRDVEGPTPPPAATD
jgi:hypothetical protein